MRPVLVLLVLLNVAFIATACDVSPPGASPDCRAFSLTVRGRTVGGEDAWTLLYVLDPSIQRTLSAEQVARVQGALVANFEVLVSGDRDADGLREFHPPRRLRAVVLDAGGRPATATPLEPPWLGDGDGPARVGDAIEVWPGERADWDAWFTDTARARVEQALARDEPSSLSLLETARVFLEEHPEHASTGPFADAQVIVVLATTRDDDSELQPERWDPWLRRRTTLGVVAAIPSNGFLASRPIDFDRLLAPQTFDESAVRCDDGAIIGTYPRGLLRLGSDWARSGSEIELSSPCSPHSVPLDVVRTIWGSSSSTQACLSRPLPLDTSDRVECIASALLPPSGPDRHCEDVGLALQTRVDTADGIRERCALDQISRAVIGGPAPGFYYDDFAVDVGDACGEEAPQRLTVWNVELPSGTMFEGRCATGTAPCGLTQDSDAGPHADH